MPISAENFAPQILVMHRSETSTATTRFFQFPQLAFPGLRYGLAKGFIAGMFDRNR